MRTKYKTMLGQSFGRLIVMDFAGVDEKRNKLWLCKCSCGGVKLVKHQYLIAGKTRSCGCLKREHQWQPRAAKSDLARVEALFLLNYKALRRRNAAKFKNSKCICFKTFKRLTLSRCVYCGEPYSKQMKERDGNLVVNCNGIDRIDCSRGYEGDNVVTACTTCNMAKNAMTIEGFLMWVNRVYNNSLKI